MNVVINVANLTPGCIYIFMVAAVNTTAAGEFSEESEQIRTLPSGIYLILKLVPEVIAQPDVIEMRARDVTILIKRPLDMGETLTSFTIQKRGGGFREFGVLEDYKIPFVEAQAYNRIEEHKKSMSVTVINNS